MDPSKPSPRTLKPLSKIKASKLPADRSAWAKVLRNSKLKDVSIFDDWQLSSASEMKYPQAILMRAIFPPIQPVKDIKSSVWTDYIPSIYIERAEKILKESRPFQNYLRAIPKSRRQLSHSDWEGVGAFATALNDQLLIRGEPSEVDYILHSKEDEAEEGNKNEDEDEEEKDDDENEEQLVEQLGHMGLSKDSGKHSPT
ncbi:hypothetical protein GGR53DRAFT_462939 [Hypoxylon sp. FL1150]|nr:hypothetical protein GGR53DRAFT_462939 [Hypoxylon sp. FL1150]